MNPYSHRLFAKVVQIIERNERLVLAAIAVRFIIAWVRAASRPLWLDELFTFYISRLNTVSEILRAIPADGNPPLYYFLGNACLHLRLQPELALRIPSMAGFVGALLAVYFFVRRRLGVAPAIFGMLVIATCPMASYASEARPYGLMLGFTGLVIASWQVAADRSDRRCSRLVPLVSIMAGIAGAIVSHHYGILHVGVPLVCAEATRLIKRRRLDVPLYAACAVGSATLLYSVRFAQGTSRILVDYVLHSSSFFAKPSWWNVFDYFVMILWWVPGLIAIALWAAGLGGRKNKADRRSLQMPAADLAAATGLASMTVIMILIASIATGYFLPRYAIGATIGVAVLAAVSFSIVSDTARMSAAAAVCSVLLFMASLAPTWPNHAITRPLDLETIPSGDPIVVASAVAYMPLWRYSSDALRARLHYLADPSYAVSQPDFLPELFLVMNQPRVPSKVDDFRQFVSSHRRFLLYLENKPRLEWVKDRLIAEHWKLTTIYTSKVDALVSVESPNP